MSTRGLPAATHHFVCNNWDEQPFFLQTLDIKLGVTLSSGLLSDGVDEVKMSPLSV